MKNGCFEISIPMPLQIVVEDVGWWSGIDGSLHNEPFRTGMGRRHHPLDYEALASLGRALGMRPQLSFVLCEWDRRNILKRVPSTTWMGKEWDNSHNIGPWLEEASHILSCNRKHLEIGLHGVGHEYWEEGILSRTEFHDQNGVMRSRDEIERHLTCFEELLEQNNLGPFPESFVPPALNHSFGNGEEGFQEILQKFGVKYVSTIFKRARNYSKPRAKGLTWECGVMLLERGEAAVPWHRIAASPEFSFDTPLLSLHWANLLHPDPSSNGQVVRQWVDFLKEAVTGFHRMPSRDTASCWTQFAYRSLAGIRPLGRGFEIDISSIREIPPGVLNNSFFVKIRNGKRVPPEWQIKGGSLSPAHTEPITAGAEHTRLMELFPAKNSRSLYLFPANEAGS